MATPRQSSAVQIQGTNPPLPQSPSLADTRRPPATPLLRGPSPMVSNWSMGMFLGLNLLTRSLFFTVSM